jgi:hypothetical protein
MEQKSNQENHFPGEEKKRSKGNTLLIIIMSCWLLVYLYLGSKSGIG